MSYMFAGFFATPILQKPDRLPERSVWRVIETPFQGVGISLPFLEGKVPVLANIMALFTELGLDAAESWMYINYDCWAGEIDWVYGLGRHAGQTFGAFDEDTTSRTQETYLALMEAFGVSAEDALNFAPFARGYWENGGE